MPGSSSSLVSPALERLAELSAGERDLLAGGCPSLAEFLAQVPDPRDPRGSGHALTSLLLAAVDGKTNEISAFAPLLEPLGLAGCVVTADAMHTQRDHAEFLVTRKSADCILIVKKDQPSLYAQLKKLAWRHIGAGDRQHARGHGRDEYRTIKTATVAAGLAFPHAAQAIAITRRARPLGGSKWRTAAVYGITSLTVTQATPADLNRWVRGPLAHRGPAPHPRRHLRRRRLPDPHPATAPRSWPPCATPPSAS